MGNGEQTSAKDLRMAEKVINILAGESFFISQKTRETRLGSPHSLTLLHGSSLRTQLTDLVTNIRRDAHIRKSHDLNGLS